MRFYKLCIGGTDYIAFDAQTGESRQTVSAKAGALCKRNNGIGANGIILYKTAKNGFEAEVILPDGSERRFDADAAVCLAALFPADITNVRFCGGTAAIKRMESGAFELYPEKATFLPGEIPLACSVPVIKKPVETGNRIITVTALRLGTVYAVHETYDLERLNTDYLGEMLTRHSLFKKNADAVFVQKTDDDAIKVQCYRKGSGTVGSDCGAGLAAAAALCRTGVLKYGVPVNIEFAEGKTEGVFRRDNSAAIKTQAYIVYNGNIDL